MSNDALTFETLELAGKPHRLRQLTKTEWTAFAAWLKKNCPSPLTRAVETIRQAKDAGTPLDPVTSDQLLDHAHRTAILWPPRVGTADWLNLVSNTDGADARLLFDAITKSTPTFTAAEAESLAGLLSPEEWAAVIRILLRGARPTPDTSTTESL
jgi:hypothetical protein